MKQNFEKDYLATVKKLNREQEIQMYGKQISYNKIKQSKKVFNRKNFKLSKLDY